MPSLTISYALLMTAAFVLLRMEDPVANELEAHVKWVLKVKENVLKL